MYLFVLYKFFLKVFEQPAAVALDHAVMWEACILISSGFWAAEKPSSWKPWKNLHVSISFGTWSRVIVG